MSMSERRLNARNESEAQSRRGGLSAEIRDEPCASYYTAEYALVVAGLGCEATPHASWQETLRLRSRRRIVAKNETPLRRFKLACTPACLHVFDRRPTQRVIDTTRRR